jgi:hypothetical protein
VARSTPSTVEQHFYSVSADDKRRAADFENARHEAGVCLRQQQSWAAPGWRLSLEREGLKTTMHDKSQDERLKALEAFKSGEVDLLVCTDVAARLDIKDVPAVFFDVPFNAEDLCTASAVQADAGASSGGDGLSPAVISAWWRTLKNSSKPRSVEPMEFDEDQPRCRSLASRGHQ